MVRIVVTIRPDSAELLRYVFMLMEIVGLFVFESEGRQGPCATSGHSSMSLAPSNQLGSNRESAECPNERSSSSFNTLS